MNNATFELHKAEDVTGDSPSTYAIKSGAEPYDTAQANGMTYPYDIEGCCMLPTQFDKACTPLSRVRTTCVSL